MKHLVALTILVVSLCSCDARLNSYITRPGKGQYLVTQYCLPKKLLQVTATYTVQQQVRYHALKLKPKKGSKYRKDSFENYVVTVDGDVNLKYWLEDDAPSYFLVSNRRRGFNSTDVAYIPGTHVLKSINSSVTPAANQVAASVLKFVTAVTSTAIGVASVTKNAKYENHSSGVKPELADMAAKNTAAKTDSVVVKSVVSTPLTKIIQVTAAMFQGQDQPVAVARFDANTLQALGAVPLSVDDVPIVEIALSSSLNPGLVSTSAPSALSGIDQSLFDQLANRFTQKNEVPVSPKKLEGTIAGDNLKQNAAPSAATGPSRGITGAATGLPLKITGIACRSPYPCTLLVTVTGDKEGGISTAKAMQSSVSRVSFPQLGTIESTEVVYWQGLFDGKQSVNATFNSDDGGILSISRSRETKDASTALDPTSDLVQKTVDAYEKRKQQDSELQQLKNENDLLDARAANKAKKALAASDH